VLALLVARRASRRGRDSGCVLRGRGHDNDDLLDRLLRVRQKSDGIADDLSQALN
jgi:hypothetical protein